MVLKISPIKSVLDAVARLVLRVAVVGHVDARRRVGVVAHVMLLVDREGREPRPVGASPALYDRAAVLNATVCRSMSEVRERQAGEPRCARRS